MSGSFIKLMPKFRRKRKAAFEVTAQEGPKISYPVAVVSESKNIEAAKKALSYIENVAALEVFKKYKFLIQQ